jgi:hypothetical protein
MRRDTEQNNDTEKDTLSDKEVWLMTPYLDPDTRSESNGAVLLALVAIVSIVCAVFIVLYVRGL